VVGHMPLEHGTLVRIQASQPSFSSAKGVLTKPRTMSFRGAGGDEESGTGFNVQSEIPLPHGGIGMTVHFAKEEDSGISAPRRLLGSFRRNETGMSFRIRESDRFAFFVPFFSGTKLECPLDSIKARGTNPIFVSRNAQ
jgi:hypothetical protein